MIRRRQSPPASCFMRTSSILIIALSFFTTASAQTYYSADPKYLRVKPESDNVASAFRYSYPDTSITCSSEFAPRNFLGNIGLASPAYLLRYGTDMLGFRIYPNVLDNDRMRPANAMYYRSKGPFASLTGIAGSRELQLFRLMYTQTFRKKVNLAIRFNRYTSTGFYTRQQTYTNNLMLTSNHASASGRWGYYLFLLNNGNQNQENGGITDTLLNDSTAAVRKELVPVRLRAASRDNRETRVMLNPWLRLNKQRDSSAGHFLQLKSQLTFVKLIYTDAGINGDEFYRFVFLDTVRTRDSLSLRNFRNELRYSFVSEGKRIRGSAGYLHATNLLWQHSDSLFTNEIVSAMLAFAGLPESDTSDAGGFSAKAGGEYIFRGRAAGNIKAELNAEWRLADTKLRVFADLLFERRNPDYIHTRWISNHFYWVSSGFGAQESMQAQAGVHGRYFGISGLAESVSNYLYFDESALPRQYAGPVTNTSVRVHAGGILFRHLGVFIEAAQQNSSRAAIVRMPPQVFTGRLFYHSMMFRNNLQLQIGGQLQFYGDFTPYAFMPATQVFHLQDGVTSTTYPYVDVFLQGRIRPVTFFLKMENVLQSLAGSNYSLVRGYYQPDRAFRFGLTWMFFD
jgi:hypothetical protein